MNIDHLLDRLDMYEFLLGLDKHKHVKCSTVFY